MGQGILDCSWSRRFPNSFARVAYALFLFQSADLFFFFSFLFNFLFFVQFGSRLIPLLYSLFIPYNLLRLL